MTSLVEELLGYQDVLLEADKEDDTSSLDTDSADSTKDKADTTKEKDDTKDDATDVKDDTTEDPPADDTTDTEDTTDPDVAAATNPDDPSTAPSNDKLDADTAAITDTIDWEKKLYVFDQFEEVFTTYNGLSNFIENTILNVNYSTEIEQLMKRLLEKVNFNITNLKSIVEGNLLISLKYSDLEKLLVIYRKDLDNIGSIIKVVAKSSGDEKK